jgi:hypothetical protein
MYIRLVMVGKWKYIQLSHWYLSLVLVGLKFLL